MRIFAAAGAVVAALAVLGTVVLTRADRGRSGSHNSQSSAGYFTSLQGLEMNSADASRLGTGLPMMPPSAIKSFVTPTKRPLTVDTGCRLGRGSGDVPTVPAAVKTRIDRVWDRLERWLSAHTPASAKSLAPPASAATISQLQKDIGVTLPPELVASLQRHDGTGESMADVLTLPPFYKPMSAHWITQNAKTMCDVLASGENESVGSWWDGQVVPFAVDGGGGALLIDQRQGREGKVGEHSEESPMDFDRWPATLTDLLEQTATALETGQPFDGRYRPMVTEKGELDWEIIR